MFFPGSRYAAAGTYQATRAGRHRRHRHPHPAAGPRPVLGWHRRGEGERLDLHRPTFLNDPTPAWMLVRGQRRVYRTRWPRTSLAIPAATPAAGRLGG